MKSFFVFIILLIATAAGGGCGHKKPPAPKLSETASETTPEVSNDSVPPPAASAPAAVSPRPSPAAARTPRPAEPVRIESESLVGIVHPFMTDQLKRFIEENGRFPRDFGEFASTRMDSVPRAPEGFRFAIDRTTVEVKLVKK